MLLTRAFGGLRAFQVPDRRSESTATVADLLAEGRKENPEQKAA